MGPCRHRRLRSPRCSCLLLRGRWGQVGGCPANLRRMPGRAAELAGRHLAGVAAANRCIQQATGWTLALQHVPPASGTWTPQGKAECSADGNVHDLAGKSGERRLVCPCRSLARSHRRNHARPNVGRRCAACATPLARVAVAVGRTGVFSAPTLPIRCSLPRHQRRPTRILVSGFGAVLFLGSAGRRGAARSASKHGMTRRHRKCTKSLPL
jgi:hypothetical protein